MNVDFLDVLGECEGRMLIENADCHIGNVVFVIVIEHLYSATQRFRGSPTQGSATTNKQDSVQAFQKRGNKKCEELMAQLLRKIVPA